MLASVRRGTIRLRPYLGSATSNSSSTTSIMGMRFMCAAAATTPPKPASSSSRAPHVSEQSKQTHAKRKPFDKVRSVQVQ